MSHVESEIHTKQVRKGERRVQVMIVLYVDTEKDESESFSITSKVVYMQASALFRL